MGVTPVEMQVMIPKAVDVASQQSSEMHKINAGQQNLSAKETERQQENTKKVHDRNSAEKIFVDEEEKEKKEKENERKKSNTEEGNQDESENDKKLVTSGPVGGHFDVSV